MTTRLLSGTYGSGYTIHAPTTVVSITSSGYVEGAGVQSQTITSAGYTIINQGRIHSTQAGVYLRHGGAVTNGSSTNTAASIFGAYAGVGMLGAAGTVTNYGSITSPGGAKYEFAAVSLGTGGRVTNGSSTDTRALISGYDGVGIFATPGTVSNFGTIIGTGGASGGQKVAGIYLAHGGGISNASAGVIKGATGIKSRYVASVTNYGTITDLGQGGGVRLDGGGLVVNGSASATSATISAAVDGVSFGSYMAGTATLRNFGGISGQIGAYFGATGEVVNGSASDTTAHISGQSSGIYSPQIGAQTVINYGTVSGSSKWGVHLGLNGPLTNGSLTDTSALITGMSGVKGATQIANFGTITGTGAAGIEAFYCTVNNGAVGDTKALIQGVQALYLQRNGTVTNFGTILGTGGSSAISLNPHGYLGPSSNFTNGTATDTTALISGAYGIDGKQINNASVAPGAVVNFGTIIGTSGSAIVLGHSYSSSLRSYLSNGSSADVSATIKGGMNNALGHSDGVSLDEGVIINFGTILTSAIGYGVRLSIYGSLTNGAADDKSALIEGYGGVYWGGGGTLTNYGAIIATKGDAIRITSANSTLVTEAGSSIQGNVVGAGGALDFAGGTGTITTLSNSAIIVAGATSTTNFANFKSLALGSAAVFTLSSAGTISSGGETGTIGPLKIDGRLVVTGSLLVTTGTVNGAGLLSFSSGTGIFDTGEPIYGPPITVAHIDMFGTSTVLLKTGFNYAGVWDQVSGTLSLASGATLGLTGVGDSLGGTVTGAGILQVATGTEVIVRSMTLDGGVTFDNQGQVNQSGVIKWKKGFIDNERGSNWSLAGASGILLSPGANGTFVNDGVLTVSGGSRAITISADLSSTGVIDITSGTLSLAGGLTAGTGVIQGAGTLALTRGFFSFSSNVNLNVASISVTGASTVVEIGGNFTYRGAWVQTGGALSIDGGSVLNLIGPANAISGSVRGSGTLVLSGAVALSAVTLSVPTVQINSAAVSLSGAIKLYGVASMASSNITIASTGVSLQSGGTLALSEAAGYGIRGATTTTRLVNLSDTITGYGDIGGGQMVLLNEKAGVIENNGPGTLVVDTGGNAIVNAGLIECSIGSLTIDSKINNNGTLMVASGTLTVNGAVVGVGGVQVNGGLADFTSYFNQRVTFGAAGVLELSHSTAYTGTVFGFSTAGATSLDLGDIAFGAGTKASYKGNTKVGILTVSDGVRTAQLKLIGDYTSSIFTLSDDGHGGTSVTDPAKPNPTAFVAAMAGVGASQTAGVVPSTTLTATPPQMLAKPGLH